MVTTLNKSQRNTTMHPKTLIIFRSVLILVCYFAIFFPQFSNNFRICLSLMFFYSQHLLQLHDLFLIPTNSSFVVTFSFSFFICVTANDSNPHYFYNPHYFPRHHYFQSLGSIISSNHHPKPKIYSS